MELHTRFVTQSDDLAELAAGINSAQWDEANDLDDFSADALLNYLRQADNWFVVCEIEVESGLALAGIASGRIQHKPYDNLRWLYVDEVDTTVNYRKRGVAKSMMRMLLEFANQHDMDEVWLGTEPENVAANGLYKSLGPDEVEKFVGYTWNLE